MSKIKSSDAIPLFRLLCRTRALQEALIIHRSEIPGPAFTGMGQEAAAVVPLFALQNLGILDKSALHFDHRMIFSGVSAIDGLTLNSDETLTLDLLRNFFCRATGGNRGRDGNVHIGWPERNIVPFGSSDMGLWSAVLLGFVEEKARKEGWYDLPKEERPIGLAYFGDGASNQGLIHEAMNWAWTYRLPIIFGINNNQVALFTTPEEGYGGTELYKRAGGYGDMIGIQVDGMDPAAVYKAMHEAVRHAQDRVPVLLELCTKRLTGHNEDHVNRVSKPEELREKRNFFDVRSIDGLDDAGLAQFREDAENEPLRRMQHWLVEHELLSGETSGDPLRDHIIDEERDRIDALVEQILKEPKITIEEDRKDRSTLPPLLDAPVHPDAGSGKTERMRYNESFWHVVGNIMETDERVTYSGQDIGTKEGGVLATTKGLVKRFGRKRVRNTPISEEVMVAVLAGQALAGARPFFEFQFAPFYRESSRVFRHVIVPQWFQKKYRFGLIPVFSSGIVGDKGGSGTYHEDWPERELLTMPGLAIVAPANAYEVVGLVRAAYESGWPVALLLQTSAASSPEFASDIPLDPYTIPLGKAKVVREGTDFTVVAYGAGCVAGAYKEAEDYLAPEGISVEVINLRTIRPWDKETVRKSLDKTGRIVFMHEDYHGNGSPGQMLSGELAQEKGALRNLCLPHVPILGASTPFVPTDYKLVLERLPYEICVSEDGKQKFHRSEKLAAIIRDGMKYKVERR